MTSGLCTYHDSSDNRISEVRIYWGILDMLFGSDDSPPTLQLHQGGVYF